MKRKAFTLVELLVVVAIITILSISLIPKILDNKYEAKLTKTITDAYSIETFLVGKNITPEETILILNRNEEFKDLDNAFNKSIKGINSSSITNADSIPNDKQVIVYSEEPTQNTISTLIDGTIAVYNGKAYYKSKKPTENNYVQETATPSPTSTPSPTPTPDQLNLLQLGQYVKYGNFNGYDLTWQVVKKADGDVMLFMTDSLKNNDGTYLEKPFDKLPSFNEPTDVGRNQYGSNNYYYSDIREWLNGSFYNTAFTNNTQIKDTTHEYILADIDANQKTSGTSSHIHNAILGLSLQNYETTAYKRDINDKVYLISILELVKYIQPVIGAKYYYNTHTYWTRDSYSPTSYAVRYVASNGNIVTMDANYNYGRIRIGINLKSAIITTGTGSQSDPYIID